MTDKKKAEEINDQDLDQVAGGLLQFEIQDVVKTPKAPTGIAKPSLNMETKFEDE